jgi:hemerythrin-like domain-containing protein
VSSKEAFMKPRGILMIEHRLIEKMLGLMKSEVDKIENGNLPDLMFLDSAIDFIRVYADRTHHGKEEDILFFELSKKKLVPEDEALMQGLIEDHKSARHAVMELIAAKDEYFSGNTGQWESITTLLTWLSDFYPRHIKKEDDVFFPRTEQYFSSEELGKMLSDFGEFDRKMIHEKYTKVVDDLKALRDIK